jgi:hypothetical protein
MIIMDDFLFLPHATSMFSVLGVTNSHKLALVDLDCRLADNVISILTILDPKIQQKFSNWTWLSGLPVEQ